MTEGGMRRTNAKVDNTPKTHSVTQQRILLFNGNVKSTGRAVVKI